MRCCGPQRRPNCARVHLVFACKLLYTNTHIHTRFLALSPLINSVTGACVFVHDTTEVHQPCLPRALLTDCWTIAGYKGAHHAGIQTYDEISNHVVEECVCVGACLHTHTHTHVHLIELLLYSTEGLPLSHYDLLVATRQHYRRHVVLFT